MKPSANPTFRTAFLLMSFLLIFTQIFPQCSSLYNTPEFPIGTHPSDGHTMSWGVNLFTPTEFGGPSVFTGLQIFVDNSYGPTTYTNQDIYMRHTNVSSYPNADYPGTAGWVHVFSGTYNFPWSGLVTIPFNVNNFTYNGLQNVEILFENRSNNYDWNEPWFRRTPSYGAGNYRSKWNGDFGWGSFPGTSQNGSAVRLTYTLSMGVVGGNTCGTILASLVHDFQADREGEQVRLNWLVEGNESSGFSIWRSEDGQEYEKLKEMTAEIGKKQFGWVDETAPEGKLWYRLEARDVNGGMRFQQSLEVAATGNRSGILGLWRDEKGLEVEVLVQESGAYEFLVVDLLGRELYRQTEMLEAGRGKVLLPEPSFPGTCILKVAGKEGVWQTKFR